MAPLLERARDIVNSSKAKRLYRQTYATVASKNARFTHDGKEYLGFCSNDYLGLANHKALIVAQQDGVKKYGLGAGSAHLIIGHSEAHGTLEKLFSQYLGVEDALLFSTGYMANIGVMSALVMRDDVLYSDRLNHASLIDAQRLSRAKVHRYGHLDLAWVKKHFDDRRTNWIVSDGIFSMDGDSVDTSELLALSTRCNIYIDDAHGFGVIGGGRGVLGDHKIPDNLLYMATLGKAAGVSGALVGGKAEIIDALRQVARTWMFTTAMPPSLSCAAQKSMDLIFSDEGSALRQKLQANISHLREGLLQQKWVMMDSQTPIQPILVGCAEDALELSFKLREQGFWVPAIRPPTVPEGEARLRITLSAAHSSDDIDAFLDAMEKVL